MATPPITPKGVATRQRLLDAAREVAVRTGGHVEVAAVAEAAGVVPSMVNRYFGSRSGLLTALLDDYFARLHAEVLDERLDEGRWVEVERRRLERGVAFLLDDPAMQVTLAQLARDAEVARAEAAHVGRIIEQSARNIRRAQRRGEVPASVEPRLAAAAMFGALRQVLLTAATASRRPPRRRIVELLWRQVLAAVDLVPEGPGRA